MRERLQWMKPFIGIVLGLFLLEVVWSNWYGMTIPKNTHQVLARDVWTEDNGSFETAPIILDTYVKNVYIALGEDGAEQVEITFSLTDEGDRYAYELPARNVLKKVSDTSYIALYPFGKVNTLQVKGRAVADNPVHVAAIEVNRPMPLRFHMGRFLFLMGFVLFVYLSCQSLRGNRVMEKYFLPSGRGILIACSFLTIAVIGWKLVHINPVFVNPPWPHHRQYQELAQVLAKGQVYLDQEPSEGLLQAENPYDTIALQAEQIPYLMDYAFHEGKYYVYFGIVPELLCFLPFYLITRNHLANYQVIYLFYLLFVIGVFGLVRELFYLQDKKTEENPGVYLLLCTAVCLLPNYLYILTRPDMYHIPIMSATALLTLSLFLLLAGIRKKNKKHRILLLVLGALCGAGVAGCRPQFLLYEFLFPVVIMGISGRKEEKPAGKVAFDEVFALLLPYLLLGGLFFWYNKARFGSGFDFGATYSLTSNDMNHRGFSMPRMIQGVFCFLFQPADIRGVFPFVFKPQVHFELMSRDLSEFTFGGMLTNMAFLWPVMLVPLWKKQVRGIQQIMTVGFSVCSLIICAFDANSAGVLQRYMADGVWGLWIAAVLLWMNLLHTTDGVCRESERRMAGFFVFSLTGTFLFGFFMMFAMGDANGLRNTNPELYYRICSWFT